MFAGSQSAGRLPTLTLTLALATALPAASAFAATPELPRAYVDTTYVPPTGATLVVPAGGNLQAALDAAHPGDVVTLHPGATFTGTFTLPVNAGTGWIIVRSAAPDRSLPAAGARIDPSYAPVLPKIVSPGTGPALQTAPGAHHFRFIGVEFTVAPAVTQNYGLVALGDGSAAQNSLSQVPHHLILDRVYIHGNRTVNLQRGVSLQSATSAVIDSYVSDCHQLGADAQAIAGWNGPGPFKITNNHLEASTENVLFGGADPAIPDLVPSDIEVRGNHLFKPLFWRIGNPCYAGTAWSVKNLFELKNAQRILVDGNIFESNWLHAQNGFAILFTVRNQNGSAPWSVVQDITFTRNIVRHTGSGVNVLGVDNNYPSQQTRRILIKGNLFEDVNGAMWGGDGRLFQMLDGAADVVIDHNTAFQSGSVIQAAGVPDLGFVYTNNLAPNNQYGVAGDGTGNPLLTLSTYFPGALFSNNILTGGNILSYPPGNFFPASWSTVGFVDFAGGNYRLAGASPYKYAGTDGQDVGADIDALQAATAGAIGAGGSPQEGFYTVPPTRLLDTRLSGPNGGPALVAGTDRIFAIAGQCGIPSTAKAVSVNVAVTGAVAAGNLTLYPAGTPRPPVSAINYVAGQTRSNNAIIPLNTLGQLAVYCSQASGTAQVILDVNGVFQ